MYQLRPGGTGGSYGAMFLDVLAPVCAPACQIVCGQRLLPALIRCQWGLAGSWHPDTSPSIRWHRVVGGIKNDPIRGWQCVLTGTTWWGVFKNCHLSPFPSSHTVFLLYTSLLSLSLLFLFSLYFLLVRAFDSGRDVTRSACLPWHSLFVRVFQLFAANIPPLCKCTHARGLVLTKNTVIRELSDRNIIHRVSLSVFIAMTDKSLDLPFSFSVSLYFVPALHPPSILHLSVSCVAGVQLEFLPVCVSVSRITAAPFREKWFQR